MTEENPYAAPTVSATPAPHTHKFDERITPQIVRQFQGELRALASFWLICGVILLLLVFIGVEPIVRRARGMSSYEFMNYGGLLLVGCGWIAAGVFAFFRNRQAVHVGLMLNYLCLVIPYIWIGVVFLFLVAVAIMQAHRILRWMDDFQAARISFHVRPHEVARSQ